MPRHVFQWVDVAVQRGSRDRRLRQPCESGLSHFVPPEAPLAALRSLDTARFAVVKSHEIDVQAGAWLDARARCILITLRDPRDAVLSLIRYQRLDFPTALDIAERSAMACITRADDRRALILRYEDGFTEDPTTVERAAKAMGYELCAADYKRILADNRREAVETYIAQLARSGRVLRQVGGDDFFDPITHWHKHHAGRTGRIGGWREGLASGQSKMIEDRFSDRMALWP